MTIAAVALFFSSGPMFGNQQVFAFRGYGFGHYFGPASVTTCPAILSITHVEADHTVSSMDKLHVPRGRKQTNKNIDQAKLSLIR